MQVSKAANGDLEQAPLRKIGLIAADALRVEPMRRRSRCCRSKRPKN